MHPVVGGRLLANHPLADLAIEVVVGHHKRTDGKGYPRGIAGNLIPGVARIVGIVDAFDAMTSTRPYRNGMPMEKALKIIGAALGSQFDAKLGHHFLALDRSKDIAHTSRAQRGWDFTAKLPLVRCANRAETRNERRRLCLLPCL